MPRAKRTAEPTVDDDVQGVIAVAEPTAAVLTDAAVEAGVTEPVEPEAPTAVAETPKAVSKKRPPVALKCSVNQQQLKAALSMVRGSLPTRKSLPNPAIGLYKLVANRAKKRLSVTTYNEIVATTVDIPANVVVEGELLVSKDLGELVAELPDAGITLSAETVTRLQVILDNRTFSPKSMSASGYPDLVSDDEAGGSDETEGESVQATDRYKVSTEALRRALEFVCPGALTEGSDAEASILNAVRLDLWHGKKTDVFAVASSDDGCLLVDESTVVADAAINLRLPQATVCVPVKSCQILLNLLNQALEDEEEGTLTITLLNQNAHTTLCQFQGGGKRLLTHLVTGEWPDYRQHMPKAEQFKAQVIADRELLLSLVNCNLVFAMAKSLRTMMFDAFSRDGIISTWVKTQSKGESVQEMVATVTPLHEGDVTSLKPFGFNTVKVKLALGLFSDTEIRWQFINTNAPTLLSGGTKGRWIVMMPLAVNENEPEVDETTKPETKAATKKP